MPFVVGIYEAQLENLDHELAHLIEKYMHEGDAVGIMKPQSTLHRIIPAQKAVKSRGFCPAMMSRLFYWLPGFSTFEIASAELSRTK